MVPTGGHPRHIPRGWLFGGAILALVLAGLVGGLIGGALGARRADTGSPSPSSGEGSCDAAAVAKRVLPSIVTLDVTGANGARSNGSGEFLSRNGYILTNDHVIAAAANGGRIAAITHDGESMQARIVGRVSVVDLAVLRAADARSAAAIDRSSSSEDLRVGEPVVALGAPLGLSSSVTSGIVSALGREISLPAADNSTAHILGAVQTDAAINPGNSGGALVNCRGHLVGVNTAIATVPGEDGQAGGGNVGIGFAIPSDYALEVADQIMKTGTFQPPRFGANAVPAQAQVGGAVTAGLYVQSVVNAGPADKAGLRAGDFIVRVAGKAATSSDVLTAAVVNSRVGDQLRIDYQRDGRSHSADVTLDAVR